MKFLVTSCLAALTTLFLASSSPALDAKPYLGPGPEEDAAVVGSAVEFVGASAASDNTAQASFGSYRTLLWTDYVNVYSRGVTKARYVMPKFSVANYICLDGGCTAWTSRAAYRTRGTVWAGWIVTGAPGYWYTRSAHAWVYGGYRYKSKSWVSQVY